MSVQIPLGHYIDSPWIETETIPYANLNEFFQLADDSKEDWEHTVSWIDCIQGKEGRGLFMRGNPTKTTRQQTQGRMLALPFTPLYPWLTDYRYALSTRSITT